MAAGIERGGSLDLVEPPVSDRLRGQHGLGVGTLRDHDRTPWLPRDLLQELQHGRDDLRLGLDLQPGGARRPGRVTAECMLLGGRDVALGAVGQLDVHRQVEGALRLELQPGDGVDLVRDRGDAQLADPDGLELQLAAGLVVQVDGLPGVDFGQGAGKVRVLHPGDDLSGPGQPGLVGQAAAEDERRLGHGQRDMVVIRDRPIGPFGRGGDGIGVGVEARVLLRAAVVHPHLVAAGALRHDRDERRGGGTRHGPGSDPFRERRREPAVVIGRDGLGAVVVHRVVGQHGDGPAGARLDRQDGQRRVDRSGGGDDVGVLVAGVHVGPDGPLAEGIVDHPIGSADPSPAEGVLGIVHGAPADAGRLEVRGGALDRRGDPGREGRGISGVGRGAQGPHHRRRRVGVRGRDQHPIDGDPGLLHRAIALARSISSRGIMQLSTTTIASRVEPSSRTTALRPDRVVQLRRRGPRGTRR